MIRKIALAAILLLPLVFLVNAPAQQGEGKGSRMQRGMMGRIPESMDSPANPITEAKVTLGRALFYDPRLSKDQDVSCNSCHSLKDYGVDGKAVSTGHKGQVGNRNSPTVYHAAGHISQFWDGRASDVEEQAKGPVLNPVEMSMSSEADVVKTLRSIAGYRPLFQKAFPGAAEPVTFDNMAKAIGAFERKLVTPSRWDRFLNGDQAAITSEERAGHQEFMRGGCASCHTGPYVGGQSFQKLGARQDWPNAADLGRIAVTKNDRDRMVFKVPSLRNVEKTGPYFHNGKVGSLDEAVRLMGQYQLDAKLDERQVKQIVAWLRTLTGEIPHEYIRPPALPQ